jgi:high-affinity iron transporter
MSRHGRELVAELRAAGEAVVAGSKSLLALAIVVAIAVLREGSEVVLFLYGVAAAQGGASWAMVAGGFVGLILGSSVCLLTYLGLITIPARYLFGVTSALIALLAAGMAAQAIAFLEQANILTALDETMWNTSWILSDSSFLGRALHTLVGYVDQPTAMQVVVYAATLGTIVVLMKLFATPAARHPRTA